MDINSKKALYEAFKSQDARFDGQFFVAVSSTGIYCRPVCHGKMPKFENCTFFKTAAEAEQAGYRPCLVCRPELAPDHSCANLNETAVCAAKYIEENCSRGIGVRELSAVLGCSDRHLRRLFKEAYHVTPVEYLQTCRLLLAKKLLTETDLSVLDAAMASGFGSVRRLNDAFRNKYKLSPTALRKKQNSAACTGGQIKVGLGYRAPYQWERILRFLGERAIDGVEVVKDQKYYRTVRQTDKDGRPLYGWICVEHVEKKSVLAVTLSESLLPVLSQVLSRVKMLFDLDCDPNVIYERLKGLNQVKAHAFLPGTRLPGCMDEFELCLRAVLGQQITVKAARTLAKRVAAAFGKKIETGIGGLEYVFPAPTDMASLAKPIEDQLGPLGIIASRARAIEEIASIFVKHEIEWGFMADPDQVRKRLMEIRGIGPWTANYIAMRALGYPDAFLETDAGVKEAMEGYTKKEIAAMSAEWSPWRSYAVMGLWNSLEDNEKCNHGCQR